MEDNNYGIPVIEQANVCCQRCGSMNITYQREQIGSTGAANTKSKTRVVSPRKVKGKAQTVTAYNTIYQTTAVCNNCGNTWITAGGAPAKPEKKPLSPLEIILISTLALSVFAAIVASAVSGTSKKSTTKSSSSSVSITTTAATITQPEITAPISNFSYEIEDNTVKLRRFKGKSGVCEVAPTYEIDGTEYTTDLSDFRVDDHTVKTVIFDEGITETETNVFNSASGIQNVFFPKSMTVVYDYTLSYLHPKSGERITIYYAGTQEEWNAVFTDYQRPNIEDTEFGEEMGGAIADALNEKLGLMDFDSSKFIFVYSATVDDIK